MKTKEHKESNSCEKYHVSINAFYKINLRPILKKLLQKIDFCHFPLFEIFAHLQTMFWLILHHSTIYVYGKISGRGGGAQKNTWVFVVLCIPRLVGQYEMLYWISHCDFMHLRQVFRTKVKNVAYTLPLIFSSRIYGNVVHKVKNLKQEVQNQSESTFSIG